MADRLRASVPGWCCGAPRSSVHAIDEAAASIYEHHGFVAVPGNPQRLVQKISDIAAALGG
jgi:hypothetical protein